MRLRRTLMNVSYLGIAARFGVPAFLLFLGINAPAYAANLEYLGMRIGASQADIVRAFKQRGIPTEQTDPDTLSAPRPLVPLEHVQQFRLHFSGGKLDKIRIYFELPPMEPTAAKLLDRYYSDQKRLSDLFGKPQEDTAAMDAPSVQDRYDWIARARGYYRSVWVTDEKVEITLWLYGSDEGIVLMEVYEKQGSN